MEKEEGEWENEKRERSVIERYGLSVKLITFIYFPVNL